ncbi:MAG: hypothetical protein Q8P19_00520 [bacterium]|nr:hypothetical protein [bacterium]
MDDAELRQKLDAMEAQMARVEKTTRRMYTIIVVASVVAFVLPLIGLIFAIPTFLSTYATIGNI